MSTGQAETGLGDAPLWGHKFAVRKTTSLHPSRLTTHAQGGRDCMLMGSQECNEYVSEFLSTVDYLSVQPIAVAHFFLTVCKLGGAIPLASGCTHVTNKHIPALYPYWL